MSTLLYNPDRKNRQQFIEEFVVRTNIFNEILTDLKSSRAQYPEQNYLLIGQRGLGKTTLLTRLKYAIEDDAELKKHIIPVSFSEEQYNISELVNLWEDVASYLEDHHGFKGINAEMQLHVKKQNYEQLAFDLLVKHLDKHTRKLVLLIDNLGILLNKFEELEVRRLREILQTRSHIRIIAGSATPLESIADYHQPLYEFFKVIQLKGLTNEESTSLLKKLAEVYNESEKIEKIIAENPGRVETIRTLSGGVPRTIAMLFQVFLDNEHGSSISDLEKILDLVSPLYKHRMDDLPTQQQKIVDAVAKNWDAITVKELTERLRLDSKLISAQLRQLEKNQVIEKRLTKTKNHLYLLSERFFNIWYLMRYGRKENRQRVIWLVKFLEVWCDQNEIEKRINNYITKIKAGSLDEETSKIYGEIYSFFEKINPNTKFSLKEATPEYISNQIALSEKDIDELIHKSIEIKDWNKLLDIGNKSEKLTLKQKKKIYDLYNDQLDFTFAIKQRIRDRKNFRFIDEVYHVPTFYYTGLLLFSCDNLAGAIISNNVELIETSIKLFMQLFTSAYKELDEYDKNILEKFMLFLLMGKLYNEVMNVFNQLIKLDKEVINENKLIYYTSLKLLGKDDIEKLDNQLIEKIDQFIVSLKKTQR